MAKYSFTARTLAGQTHRGEMEAASEADARVQLQGRGLQVVTMTRAGAGARINAQLPGLFAPRVKGKDLQVFTRQFATLINAGIPVVDSLRILSEGLRSGLLKEASAFVKLQIEGGRRLAESMAQRPAVFDKLYCNMIQAGEEAGILDTILNRLAIYQEKSEKIKAQVRGALIYPAVIIVVSCIIILGILIFVIPKFEEFYSSSNQELPALTQMISNLSRSLIANWYLVLGALIGAPFVFKQWLATPSGRDSFDRFMMNAPIFGEVMRKSAIARLSRTLSTLLSSGVGVLEAIDISARTAGNIVIEQALLRSKEAVSQGRPFAAPIAKEKVFPDMVVQMISIGEQSGSMDVMLGKIADFYEDEVEVAVKAMTSLVEPLLMVVLGGIIAVIVVAMYLPVFSMAGAVGQ